MNQQVNPGTQALFALNRSGKHIYAGTAPRAEVERRRAKNRVSRKSRVINRKR